MYSSREIAGKNLTWPLFSALSCFIFFLNGPFAPLCVAQPNSLSEAPREARPSADEGPRQRPRGERKPAQSTQEGSQQVSEAPRSRDASQGESSVPWDAKIERIQAQLYPKSVSQLRRIEQQIKAVVQHARPAVVAVQMGDSVGSGVIVSADGLVLTAGHVAIQPHRPVRFMFPDGKRASGVSLGLNRSIDSGMMRITDPGPWPYVKMADADSLESGDWVVGLGQPNGFFSNRAPPVRIGRVLFQDDEVINTDCTLVGGDSGGPLLNLKGQVVGIHSRIGRRITSNFHVPISAYEYHWDRLLASEVWGGGILPEELVRDRPLLGLAGDPRAESCLITQVFPGMPAQRAGIQPGDIIRQFAGEQVQTFGDLSKLVLANKPGNVVPIVLDRDGSIQKVEVRLGQIGAGFPGAPPRDIQSEEKQEGG